MSRMHWNAGQVSGQRDEDRVEAYRTLCGRPFERAAIVTLERGAVTCKACARMLDRAAPPEAEPETFDAEPYPARRGPQLTQRELRIVERSKAGDDGWRDGAWGTVHGALEAWAQAVDAGALQLGSTSDPARFERGAPRGGCVRPQVTAAMSALEHVADVERALARAFVAPRVFAARTVKRVDGSEVSYAAVVLDVAAQRAILEHRVCGRRVRRGRRGDAIVRVACPAEDLAEQVSRSLGLDLETVTAHQIGRVVREGLDRVEAQLHARGVVRALRRTRVERAEVEGEMRVPGYDLTGAKAIADRLGVSVDTVRRYARREDDPLPIRRGLNGAVYAKSVDVDAWAERQLEHDEEAVA